MKLSTIQFENDQLKIIDQTQLPERLKIIPLNSLNKSVEAIKSLRVRGAPAIGIIAAYTIFIEVRNQIKLGLFNQNIFRNICRQLAESRPTAVNLFWAIEQMEACYNKYKDLEQTDLLSHLRQCAISIHDSDREMCQQIGRFGASIFKDFNNVITHCNAGILATGGNGTALSVIYEAFKFNNKLHVYVDETRPLGQGARLTYYELQKNGINCTLLIDSASGSLFEKNKIDAVIVGADRICLNGDFANKIGTFNLAVLAKNFNIPFFVAAPCSSFDKNLVSGKKIIIEQRNKSEILTTWGIKGDYRVYNPAFDVTEASYITSFITDVGIIKKPFTKNIKKKLKLKENLQ